MNSQPGDTLPQIKAVLDASGLAYEVWPCDDTLADTASFCAHYNVPPSHSVNAILVRSKSDPAQMALCMVPATHRLDVNRTILAGFRCATGPMNGLRPCRSTTRLSAISVICSNAGRMAVLS